MFKHFTSITTLAALIAISSFGSTRAGAATLLGLYLFEGNAGDSSGAGNNGIINGSVPFVAGFHGQAASFTNNVANFVDVNLDIRQSVNPTMTWGAWASPTTATPTGQRTVISNDNGGWDRILLAQNGQNDWHLGNNGSDFDTNVAISSGFQFVAASYSGGSGSTTTANIAGNLSTQNAGNNTGRNDISIGRNNGNLPWDGLIDSVFIFDDALDAGQLEAIRNLGETTGLNYHPGKSDQLLDLADGTTGSNVIVDGTKWRVSNNSFINSLPSDGAVGLNGGQFFLRLDSTIGGLGLAAVPEPSALALATLVVVLLGMIGWRRRTR